MHSAFASQLWVPSEHSSTSMVGWDVGLEVVGSIMGDTEGCVVGCEDGLVVVGELFIN